MLVSYLPKKLDLNLCKYGPESVVLYLTWVTVSLFPLYNAPWTDYATFHHWLLGRPLACVDPVGSSEMSLIVSQLHPPPLNEALTHP